MGLNFENLYGSNTFGYTDREHSSNDSSNPNDSNGSSDNNSNTNSDSGSDSDSGSEDNGCFGDVEPEQSYSSTRKNIPCNEIDEQRLMVYREDIR
jgi:hypothetical protein